VLKKPLPPGDNPIAENKYYYYYYYYYKYENHKKNPMAVHCSCAPDDGCK
jgi:hypothetical protein